VLFFIKKKRREKKRVFFFCEDSFRDIIREKNLLMMRAMYQAANVTKAW
jgi:hypothetical protein